MNATLLLTCPYCSNEFRYTTEVEGTFNHQILVTCDIDETEGCDQTFAVIFKPQFYIKTYKLVIVEPAYLDQQGEIPK